MNNQLNLTKLLAPVSPDTFFQEYWGKRHFFLQRNDQHFFSTLPSMADLDRLLSFKCQRSEDSVRAVKSENGHLIDRNLTSGRVPNLYEVYSAYNDGYTLIINSMELRWHLIATLCNSMQMSLEHPVSANLYVTPPDSQGFLPHSDDHEVFVLQIEGGKRWRLHTRADRLSCPVELYEAQQNSLPTSSVEFDLRAGDILYIPRGCLHEARTSEWLSIHLTIGVPVFTWLDLLMNLLKFRAEQDSAFRRALPVGFIRNNHKQLHEHIHNLLTRLDLDSDCPQALEGLKSILRTNSRPIPDGHFESLGLVRLIGPHTALAIRFDCTPTVRSSGDIATIDFGGNYVSYPRSVESALQFIADSKEFVVNDLPDVLPTIGKVALVRDLVVGGLLMVVQNTMKGGPPAK
jgi:ribosomal protein L16 Arg81 hydroxylase